MHQLLHSSPGCDVIPSWAPNMLPTFWFPGINIPAESLLGTEAQRWFTLPEMLRHRQQWRMLEEFPTEYLLWGHCLSFPICLLSNPSQLILDCRPEVGVQRRHGTGPSSITLVLPGYTDVRTGASGITHCYTPDFLPQSAQRKREDPAPSSRKTEGGLRAFQRKIS